MPDVKWIKVTTDIFDDETMKLIDTLDDRDSIFVIWIKILTLAGKSNAEGALYLKDDVPYTTDMLATIFNRSLESVDKAINVFDKYGLIDLDNDVISVMNWEKHQNVDKMLQIRQNTRRRVAECRERKRPKSNVTLHVTPGNATEQQQSRVDKIKHCTIADLRSNITVKTELAIKLKHRVGSESNKVAVEELIAKILKKKKVKDPVALAVHMARND